MIKILAVLLASVSAVAAQPLPFDQFVTGLPTASAPASSDAWYLLQGGFGRKLTTSTFLSGAYGWTGTQNFTQPIGIGPRFIAGVTPDAQLEVNMNNVATATLPGPTGIHIVGQPVSNIATGRLLIDDYQQSAAFGGRRANGTPSAPLTLNASDPIQTFNSWGWDGTGYFLAGQQVLMAGGVWSATSHPTSWQLLVTPVGSITPSVRLQVFPSGGVGIGNSTDPGAGGLALGNLTIGVPAGTTGLGAICAAANGVLYVKATCP